MAKRKLTWKKIKLLNAAKSRGVARHTKNKSQGRNAPQTRTQGGRAFIREEPLDIDSLITSITDIKRDKDAPANLLRLALRIELLCRANFAKAAKRSKNERAKDIFESLVRDEEEHIEILTKELTALERDKHWLERERVTLPITVCEPSSIRQLAKDGKKLTKIGISPTADDISALKAAVELKKNTVRFYCELGAELPGPAGKKTAAHLMNLETRHLEELQAQLTWLEESGFLFDPDMIVD